MPADLRQRVEEALGARVVRALRLFGGYAPSPTFRLFLSDHRRVVFKAASTTDPNPVMHQSLAGEERAYRELGRWLVPWAPTLYASFTHADWRVLLLEDLGPSRVPPWTQTAVRQAMRGYAAFHASTLGQALPEWLPHSYLGLADEWAKIMDERGALESVADLAFPGSARAWLRTHVDVLNATAQRLKDAPPPHALLHFDTRSDNLRLQSGGRLRLFDWPLASLGPPEVDVVAFAQSMTVEGGLLPAESLRYYTGALREPIVDAAIAGLAGFFAYRSRLPDIPGLPRLRVFQRDQLKVTLAWCAQRLNLPAPELDISSQRG